MLKGVLISVKKYLKETSIHGIKYLGQERSIISKLFWLAAVSCCFTAAYQSFKMAMIDWDETPLVTTIENTDIPVNSIQFPTITLCSERRYTFSRDLTRHLINGLKFSCNNNDKSDCQDSQVTRQAAIPSIWDYLTQIEVNEPKKLHSGNCSKLLSLALERNITNIKDIKERLIKSVGITGEVGKIRDWLKSQLPDISRADIISFNKTCPMGITLDKMISSIEYMGKLLGNTFNAIASQGTFNDVILKAFQKIMHDIPFTDETITTRFKKSFYNNGQLEYCLYLWQFLVYNNGVHPCDFENDDKLCCSISLSRSINVDLRRVMMIKKLQLPHAGYELAPEYLMSKLNITDTLAGFPVKPVGQEPRYVWDDNSIIQSCIFGRGNVDYAFGAETICKLISPVPTNAGICYAFNAERRLSLKKAKKYEEAFRFTFEAELEGPLTQSATSYEAEKGKSFVFVYTRNLKSYGANMHHGNVLLSVSDKHSFFNVRSKEVKIEPGYKRTITVRPIVKTSYGIEHLPLSKRKCRFHHEVIEDDYSIFDFYSMDSCIQECRVAYSIEKCRCVPWEIPFNDRYKWPEYPACLSYGSDCFYALVQNASIIEELPLCRERCISNCNNIKFEITQQESEPLDEYECSKLFTTDLAVHSLRQKFSRLRGLLYIHRIVNMTNSSAENNPFHSWCWESFESDLSVVEIKVDFSSMTQYRQTERVDIIGKISNLGGILGLFMGMSFLSMVEIAFWAVKSVASWIVQRREAPFTSLSKTQRWKQHPSRKGRKHRFLAITDARKNVLN